MIRISFIPSIVGGCRSALAALAALAVFGPLARAQQTVVANYSGNSLLIVDLGTGNRTVLSDGSTGTGTAMSRPVGIGRESNGTILVGQDLTNSPLFRVDPTNGNRTILSSSTVGTGTGLGYVYGITVDGNGKIYTSNFSPGAIIQVDGTTGDRTVIASSTVGSGATWSGPWGIAAEPDGNLLIAMYSIAAVYRLNPTTGVRTVVSSTTVGTGPNLVNPTGIARLSDGTIMVVNRDATDYVLRIDPTTGNRTVVSSSTVGTGTTLNTRFTISFDTNGTLYTADFTNNAILKIDPATGNRTVVSNSSTGTGPNFNSPLGILPNAVASISHSSNPPVVSSATTASGTYGSSFSYTIAASNTPASYSATGLPNGLSVDTTSGAISGTPTQNGSFTVTLGATNSDGTGNATLTLTVAKKGLTVSGVTASNKTYDRSTTATISTTSAALVGVVSGDTVTLDASAASGTFDTKDVGTGKTVTLAGLALGGASAANYTLTQPITTAAITAKSATVSGITASDKTYDGNTTAALVTTNATLNGVVSGDTVALDVSAASGTFNTKAVGSGKTVTAAAFALTGADASNYSLTQPSTTATISAKALTVTGVTASSRAYDATTNATLNASGTSLVGAISGDDVSLVTTSVTGVFANKAAGTGRTVNVSGLTLSGADATNYTLTQPATTADISTKALTVSGVTAGNKAYDGNATATISLTNASLSGIISGDTVSLNGTGASATFDTKAVGSGKTVTVASLALAGTDAGNYTLTQPTTTAAITGKTITVTGATAANKTYDGNATATPSFTNASLVGAVTGDDVTLTSTSATAQFSTKAVGTGKTVTIAGLALAGADAANYTLTQPTTTADISTKTLTVSGVTAANRVYDASTNATLAFANAALVGVVSGENVTLVTTSAAGAFATKTVDSAKTVTVTGLTLGGADAANYSLTQPAATASITAKALTVSGITAASRPYNGNATATLNVSGAALVGLVSGDTVTLVSGSASGVFASVAAGIAKTVTVTGLSLSGADSANYTLTAPTLTADITQVSATVILATLAQVYDGSPRAATATTSPSDLPVAITYDGSTTAPTAAGSYAVAATIVDPNYLASANGTLVVSKADQSLTFDQPASVSVGSATTLAARASSSLPVSFSVVSGNATLSGATLTLNDASPVTVRATQSGDVNHNAVSVDRSVSASSKLSQTITFDAIATKRANDVTFALSATASSGLPVSFSVVSGPAVVAGSQLTLTGVAGNVVVRASQAGNAAYAAAADVTQSFDVIAADTHRVYFGATQNNDTVAVDLSPDGTSATLLCYLGSTQEAFVVSLHLLGDGTFDTTVAPLSLDDGSASIDASAGSPDRVTAAAVASRTFRGQLSNQGFTGTIVELGLTFSAAALPVNGLTASISGLYQSSAINSAGGSTTSIVGTQGQVLVVAATVGVTTGGAGTIDANGAFAIAASGATITGAVNAPTATVSCQVTVPGQPTVNFSGVATTTLRTDRLVNLSSRARVGAADSGTLITGFVIGGSDSKRLLLRAIGPALTDFGVGSALANPKLRLYDVHGNVVTENDDWTGADAATAAAQTGAFGLRAGSKDAALVVTLAPGAYTMHVIAGGGSGVALAEIYDASANPQGEYQRLTNISTRGPVDSGEGVLIGGFVVTGNSPKKVLVRGIGPALAPFGVSGALANPKLSLYQNGTLLAQNDDWNTPLAVTSNQKVASTADIAAAAQATGAFGLPSGSKDAAIVVMLAPGAYTAQVSSADGTTGVALVEIYEIAQ